MKKIIATFVLAITALLCVSAYATRTVVTLRNRCSGSVASAYITTPYGIVNDITGVWYLYDGYRYVDNYKNGAVTSFSASDGKQNFYPEKHQYSFEGGHLIITILPNHTCAGEYVYKGKPTESIAFSHRPS